jgi:hypothetical protein
MLNDAFIETLREKHEAHPIYAAVQTLDDLCVGDADKWREAAAAAETAVHARISFWDGVLIALPSQHAQAA